MKMMIKKPGLSNEREQVELDLSYKVLHFTSVMDTW
jgi:hypothetical protein